MNYTDNTQLTMTVVSPAKLEVEGDRIFRSHAKWMEETHYREGEKALLQYTIAKSLEEDGYVTFVLTEVYENAAGLEDHFARTDDWEAHGDFLKWAEECKVTIATASIVHSLW